MCSAKVYSVFQGESESVEKFFSIFQRKKIFFFGTQLFSCLQNKTQSPVFGTWQASKNCDGMSEEPWGVSSTSVSDTEKYIIFKGKSGCIHRCVLDPIGRGITKCFERHPITQKITMANEEVFLSDLQQASPELRQLVST